MFETAQSRNYQTAYIQATPGIKSLAEIFSKPQSRTYLVKQAALRQAYVQRGSGDLYDRFRMRREALLLEKEASYK